MRRNVFTALSTVLLVAAFFAAASPVAQAQTSFRRQSQTTTQSAKPTARPAAATQTATNAGAYARVKNFVDADALLVARLDLAQLDLDALDRSFSKFAVDAFAAQGFDATSLKEIRRELNKSVKAFKETATPILDGYRQDRGLREVYLIVPRADEPEYFVYAPLAKSKRAAVVEFAATFAPNPPFEVGSGVVFGTKKFDADYFKRFKATPNPKLEAFFAESNATLQIYVGDVNVAPAVALVGAFAGDDLAQTFDAALAQAPQETRDAVKAFDDYFIDARLELDVNALKTNARVDFASADAANKTLVGLAKLADVVAADAEKALADAAKQNADAFEKYNVVPVARELVRGFLTSSLPKRDGAALSFELQASPTFPLANPLTGAFVFAALPQALKGVQNAAGASDATADSPRASIFSLVAPKNEKVEPAAQTDAAQTDAPEEAENVETAPSTDAPAVGKVKIAPKSDAAQADDVKQLFDAFAAATKPAKGAEESEEIVVTNPDVLNATAEGFHPTTVTVLYEGGFPAAGVLVTLHPLDPTSEIKELPKGVADKEGKAVLVTGVVPGVRPGKYRVTLKNELNPVVEHHEGYDTVVRLVISDDKYESARSSGLSVEIKEGENQFKYDNLPLYVIEPR